MPNGEVHHKYYKRGYLFVLPTSTILMFYDWQLGLGNICGYWFGRYCDPDWDVMLANSGEGRMINELPLIGHALFGLSSFYGSLFRRFHGKFITHFPIVSTFIRLVFLGIPLLLFAESLQINLIGNGWHKFWLGFWSGLSIADGIHWNLDRLYND